MQATELAASRLSPRAKHRIRSYARNPQQMAFFHVVPAETGLSRTVWASQNEDYPALLVSSAPGRAITPAEDVLVVGFDEATPFPEVNEWLARNRHLLRSLARQQIDVGQFYDGIQKSTSS